MTDKNEMLRKILEADLERLAGEREKAKETIDRMEMVLQRVDREEKKAKAQLATVLRGQKP
jgi:hypothetical protein